MLIKKVKASSLQLAMLIAVIIAVLLGSFLTLTHTHKLFGLQSQNLQKVIEAADTGIRYSLTSNFSDSLLVQIENVPVTLKKEFWGSYTKISSNSDYKKKTFSKIALLGTKSTSPKTALQVTSNNNPLSLLDETLIQGVVLASEKGIKKGNLFGHNYKRKELVDGVIKRGPSLLPTLDAEWLNYISRCLTNNILNELEVVTFQEQVQNSFHNPTKVLFQNEKILLTGNYTGNIIIKSNQEIRISPFAQLEDVIVIAPRIVVQKSFKGNAHFIAKEFISIEENVTLSYPSSLVVLDAFYDVRKNSNTGTPAIHVSDNSSVNGNVIYVPSLINNDETKPDVSLSENARIVGSVYCQGNLSLSGAVLGSVYTISFICFLKGAYQKNSISNGQILGNSIPDQFCGMPFTKGQKGIAKWMY